MDISTIRAGLRLSPQIIANLRPGVITTDPASQAQSDACACMLDAVPGLDEATRQAGMTVCLGDPAAFAAQLDAAGITYSCDGSGDTPWYRTTPGMVGIGVGAVAVLGLVAWAVR